MLSKPLWLRKSNSSFITTLNPINIQLLHLLPPNGKSVTQFSKVLSFGLIHLATMRASKVIVKEASPDNCLLLPSL